MGGGGRAGRNLGHGSSDQKLEFVVFRQEVEAVCIPAGTDMEIGIVAQGAGGDYKVLLVLIGEILESFVLAGIDDGALFKPADFVLFCLDLQEAAPVFEHFKRLSIGDFADPV